MTKKLRFILQPSLRYRDLSRELDYSKAWIFWREFRVFMASDSMYLGHCIPTFTVYEEVLLKVKLGQRIL